MIRYGIIATAFLVAGCQTTLQTVSAADDKVRDKCGYLQSAVAIAQQVASIAAPVGVANIIDIGQNLLGAYCQGTRITDIPSAMARMEKIIVAVRPLAAK